MWGGVGGFVNIYICVYKCTCVYMLVYNGHPMIYYSWWTFYSIGHCTKKATLNTIHCIVHTLYTVQCTVYIVHSTLYRTRLHCTIYCIHNQMVKYTVRTHTIIQCNVCLYIVNVFTLHRRRCNNNLRVVECLWRTIETTPTKAWVRI